MSTKNVEISSFVTNPVFSQQTLANLMKKEIAINVP